jgi:YbbR domain-containing protein
MRKIQRWPLTLPNQPELGLRVTRNVRAWWRRLAGHLGSLILSVVMGLIVWLIAINQENPLITKEYPDMVPVQLRGLPETLEPITDLASASIQLTLQAPRSAWEQLEPSQVLAYVDLTNLTQGVHQAPVHVLINHPEVVVRSSKPEQLQIELDEVITKSVPMRASIMDFIAYGYEWQTPIITPMSVTVQGPASRVQLVVVGDAQVYLRGAKNQVVRFQNVELLDEQNQPVDLVKATPPMVEVKVPVERWPGRKEVAVRVKLVGQPAAGFRQGAIKIDPSTVVLVASADRLDNVPGFVETQPVSVDGAKADIHSRVNLILPAGINVFEGDTVIDVVASIIPVESGIKKTLKPVVRGLGENLEVTVALDTVDVILSGPQSLLDSLGPDDVFVLLNLDGLLPGSHVITPDVRIPDGIRREGVLPETVEVVISELEPATPTPVSIEP